MTFVILIFAILALGAAFSSCRDSGPTVDPMSVDQDIVHGADRCNIPGHDCNRWLKARPIRPGGPIQSAISPDGPSGGPPIDVDEPQPSPLLCDDPDCGCRMFTRPHCEDLESCICPPWDGRHLGRLPYAADRISKPASTSPPTIHPGTPRPR